MHDGAQTGTGRMAAGETTQQRSCRAEAQSGALRAETARAFYAAESAGRVVIKCSIQGLTMPAASSTLILGPATATYIALPAAGQSGTVDIKAVDGTTTRRVRLTLSSS